MSGVSGEEVLCFSVGGGWWWSIFGSARAMLVSIVKTQVPIRPKCFYDNYTNVKTHKAYTVYTEL